MILVGFFCVLGAIGLLVAGLAQADPDLVWASITASAVGVWPSPSRLSNAGRPYGVLGHPTMPARKV